MPWSWKSRAIPILPLWAVRPVQSLSACTRVHFTKSRIGKRRDPSPVDWKVKVKCTLVQALRLCPGHTDHRGSRGIALPFHDHGSRKGWGVSVTPRQLFTPGKDSVPIVQEAGWAPGPVWTGAENLAPTGIRSPDRPARNQSLYRLRYPAHLLSTTTSFFGRKRPQHEANR